MLSLAQPTVLIMIDIDINVGCVTSVTSTVHTDESIPDLYITSFIQRVILHFLTDLWRFCQMISNLVSSILSSDVRFIYI